MRKNKFVRRKQQSIISIVLDLIILLIIGYAILQSNLNINGTASINNPTWNIHWANVQVTNGSVSASTPTIDSAQTTVTYSVVLNLPGDYYEFTVDAVNSGTIDGMIESITSKLNGATITNLPDYLEYTVSYSDGVPLATNQLLAAGATEKYKVRIQYRDDINLNQIPASNQTLTLQFTVKYRQATSAATEVIHPSQFELDSWETIIANVRSSNTSAYNLGDTKPVDLGSLGTRRVRVANKTTPSDCSTTGFSQTACGFVLEFIDPIVQRAVNSSSTNVGGWGATSSRTYVNDTVYNALPTVLKNAVINTTVVSSHGSDETSNNTATDKLYLLSTREIGLNLSYDSARTNTRILDYYNANNVAATRIKYNGSTAVYWWSRTAYSRSSNYFYVVNNTGSTSTVSSSNSTHWIAPAFRIG